MTTTQPRTIDPRPSDVMPVQPRHVADAPSRSDLGRRAAGVGAIGFATLVIAQNVLRASAPQPGADLDEVVTYFSDHRTVTVVLLTTFIASLACLTMFIGGTLRQLLDSRRRGWAIFGWVGASSIIALFASVMASEQAMTVVASGSNPDSSAVSALWAFHNSVFTVNLMFIGIALLGLSRATIAAGLTPRAFRYLAPIGAALLAAGTLAGPYIAAGDAMPVFGVSVLGFVVWLAFLVTTGTRLVRSEAS